jgi:hypothetical protein
MILSGKRVASSPAEAEKKKTDSKTTPTEYSDSYRDVASRGYQPPDVTSNDWSGDDYEDDSWQVSSPRRRMRGRKWSTGKTPGGTPPQGSSQNTRGQGPVTGAGPNPAFLHKHTTPSFSVKNEGAFREELEVEIQSINDQPFRGSITRQEAKHRIYKEALGCPFSNFRGARTGYKKCPTVTFMLKKAINIDDLAPFQDFSFERKYKKADGTDVVDVLKGKLKGVRTVYGGDATPSFSDEWTRIVKVEGCDYRVSGDVILEWLGLYGDVLTDLVEDVFEDSEDSEGENTTGIYSVKMRLNQNIPQLLPVDGRRIKIYYRNIIKLCTSCFGQHSRRDCKEKRVKWIDYVADFINSNPQIDPALYGRWTTILERENKQRLIDDHHFISKQPRDPIPAEDNTVAVGASKPDKTPDKPVASSAERGEVNQNISSRAKPRPEDFNLPANIEDWNQLVAKLVGLGLTSKEANASLEKRKKLFSNAMREFEGNSAPMAKKGRPKSRKNSLNDVHH